MSSPVYTDKWSTVRRALAAAGERFAELLLSVPPQAMATADWTVADTAAHVVSISGSYASMLRTSGGGLPIPALEDVLKETTVDTVAHFNEVALANFDERDPRTLAERVRGDIAEMLRVSEDLDPGHPIDWLGGSRVPAAGVLAHLINELQIHGRDIARATDARWRVSPADAALFFEIFLLGVTSYGYGRLLDWDRPERKGRIAVEFRSSHTAPAAMVLTDGLVTVEKPAENVDVKLFFDPVTLNLMLFGRVSSLRAALSGRVVVWGRRPWLLPAFMKKVRLPS
ncbi:maleylpyruvate isomerase N-terminal domain-containing protein [Actinomadura alba]|uniref:maleylpyruvate isomerase N-terminal domain-containing protein n=1 Tax=Actinomadura alba TaxID=406431 RepID=UPI0028A582B3|nr:maleylpyruvate isomerase N-terminal domain-containing protein [Actinomadura alba]